MIEQIGAIGVYKAHFVVQFHQSCNWLVEYVLLTRPEASLFKF